MELLYDVPSNILLEIQNMNNSLTSSSPPNKSQLSREKNIATYSHTVKTIQQLEEDGLVNVETSGREDQVVLTEKGKEITDALRNLKEKLD